MKHPSKFLFTSLASLFISAGVSHSATILANDTFEGSLGNWTAAAGTSLYTYGGTGINYATTGTGAGRLPINTASNPTLTLTESLELVTLEATYVTITFDYAFFQTNAGTRFIRAEYSDNGGTTWTTFSGGQIASNTSAGTVDADGVRRGSASFTRNTGLTDDFQLRFWAKNDGAQNYVAWVDNVVITSDAIPEPTTALLGGLGLLALLRRRR